MKIENGVIAEPAAPDHDDGKKDKWGRRIKKFSYWFAGMAAALGVIYGNYRYKILPLIMGRDLPPVPVVLDNSGALDKQSPALAQLLRQEISASFENQPVLIICRDAYEDGPKGWQAIARDIPAGWSYFDYFISGKNSENGIAGRIEYMDAHVRRYENYLGGSANFEGTSFQYSPSQFPVLYPDHQPPVVIWLEDVFNSPSDRAQTIYHEFGHALADLNGIVLTDDQIEPHAIVYEILRDMQLAAQQYGQDSANFEQSVQAAQQRRLDCAFAEWKFRTCLSGDSERSYYCDPALSALLRNNAVLARETIRVHQDAPPSEMARLAADLVKEHLGDVEMLRQDLTAMAPLQLAIHDRAEKFDGYRFAVAVSLARILMGQEQWDTQPTERQRAYMQGICDAFLDCNWRDFSQGLDQLAQMPLSGPQQIAELRMTPEMQETVNEMIRLHQQFSNSPSK